ncbi:MAG: Rieske 2Fe-2S domain-containing protein [Rhodanobacteraceae bacterium]
MNRSQFLCRLEDIPDGGACSIAADRGPASVGLILLRRGERVFAYYNECPHAGRNLDYLPGKFLVKGERITCAAHGATYATDSGACVGGPCRSGLVAVPIAIMNGEVHLRGLAQSISSD